MAIFGVFLTVWFFKPEWVFWANLH